MRRRVLCICKIRKLTGWEPRTTLDYMILRTAEHEQEKLRLVADPAMAERELCMARVMCFGYRLCTR